MASWVELLTNKNYSNYVTGQGHTDVRVSAGVANPNVIRGTWFPNKLCPYLQTSTLQAAGLTIQDLLEVSVNEACNSIYMITRHGTLEPMKFTIGTTATYNSSTHSHASLEWMPALTRSVLDNSITNPWRGEGKGFNISASHCEVVWGENNSSALYADDNTTLISTVVDRGHKDLYLKFVKFDISQSLDDPQFAIHPSVDSEIAGESSFSDSENNIKGEFLDGHGIQTGSKIIDQSSGNLITGATSTQAGYQLTNCQPTDSISNLIGVNEIVVPVIYFQSNIADRCEHKWINDPDFLDDVGQLNPDFYHFAMLHWAIHYMDNFKIRLTTTVDKEI